MVSGDQKAQALKSHIIKGGISKAGVGWEVGVKGKGQRHVCMESSRTCPSLPVVPLSPSFHFSG